ncbi:hypothetical protein JCM33374_g4839 [Metschnikowia sp. JCM 33374]|nr:hypothetical protein JCM33374_g4839 [Metschnikowia sp. JCM 33374]
MVLSQVINQLANPNTASNRRRRLYIPPSTNYPLFSYGGAEDQRSFLSLDESGSVYTGLADDSDSASISSARSLPSTLSSVNTTEDQASFHSWLLEEHQRRYNAADSDDEYGETADRRSLNSRHTHGSFASDDKSKTSFLAKEDFVHMKTTYAVESRMLSRLYSSCGVWWNSSLLLKYIIENDEVLRLTAQFLRILIAGGPAYIFFENAKRFLQAQGIFEAGTGVLFVSAPINIFLSWFLVWNEKYGIGYVGAPIATVINFWIMSVLIVLYVVFVDGSKCWSGFCGFSKLFSNWGQLSHLAIPGIVMLESEYVAYEIMTLLASYFGTAELAAQSAVGSIASLTYMVPFAVSIAASTRIANFVGAQNLYSAKISTKTGLLAGLAVSMVNCLILFTFRRKIAGLFTDDPDVTELIVSLFTPLVSILQIFDGLASVASGILRAQGLQKIGGIINFLAYYAFAMPLAFILTKTTDLKLKGLWIGIGSGMCLIGLIETLVILTCNWDAVLQKAGLMIEFDDCDEDSD